MESLLKTNSFSDIGKSYNMGLKEYETLMGTGINIQKILRYQSVETDILSGRTPSKNNPDYWNEGIHEFFTMKDADLNLFQLKEECTDKLTDYAVEDCKNLLLAPAGTLLVSNAMTIGLAIIAQRDVYINQNVFALNLDESKYNKIFLKWYFNMVLRPKFQIQYESKYLSKDELAKVILPNISIEEQNIIATKILEIENEISALQKEVLQENEVITKVFEENLKICLDSVRELKSQKLIQSTVKFNNLSFANYDLRMGYKYQSPIKTSIEDILKELPTVKLKSIVDEPIVLGESISQKDYSLKETNEYSNVYISMASIKHWIVTPKDCAKITDEYYNSTDKRVQPKDIIMARSGEGTIGKVGIVPSGLEGIFADFTMRIRVSEKYCPYFIYYYLRSDMIQLLIESYKKGLGNNTNIFPNEINEFPIPNLNYQDQIKVVEEINLKLKKSSEKLELIQKITLKIKNLII